MPSKEDFKEWLLYAIDRVGPQYFNFSERVYCYELYHYIRVAMHYYRKNGGEMGTVSLHAELSKNLNDPRIQDFRLAPLHAQRYPDFLFHDPYTADHQIAAMEVKTVRGLTYEEFADDVHKLSDLRVNYKYELVVFHCINVGMNQMRGFVRSYDARDLDDNVLVVVKRGHDHKIESAYIGDLR